MSNVLSIHWFRQDLRLQDNPALILAAQRGKVLPIYIVDDTHAGPCAYGEASNWWLHHSLKALQQSLKGHLSVYKGDPCSILPNLVTRLGVGAVYWNRCYEPWQQKRDQSIKAALKKQGIHVTSENASLLWEPWNIIKQDGSPYKVFTPFYRKGCLQAQPPREPLPTPADLACLSDHQALDSIDALALLPIHSWGQKLAQHNQVGEDAAWQRMMQFIDEGLDHYKDGRNLPAKPYVSRLSPHLRFGEISPHQLWHAMQQQPPSRNTDHFCSELGWREFSYSQLYHNPNLPRENLQAKFNHFPWLDNPQHLHAWQKGLTGIPMVDAGMRQLWQTGYMHNRLRMIVGSFLVKNLRLHWHHGERWFWNTLVDADLANNSAGWQWIAGCGADAAPYFRIFNPVTQGQKFDPDGDYVRHYCPELRHLPNAFLFNPWDAPSLVLQEAGVCLGENYPYPIVDLAQSRAEALNAFQTLKT
ncbi:MAG: deoxyribodipyrimidine photo-lyase [Pseudomonadota bacterium]|nr:deoxyribodipyrimidine photo-lyase [Pseudomonadota bacterium]